MVAFSTFQMEVFLKDMPLGGRRCVEANCIANPICLHKILMRCLRNSIQFGMHFPPVQSEHFGNAPNAAIDIFHANFWQAYLRTRGTPWYVSIGSES